MDSRRQKVLVVRIFTMVLRYMMVQVFTLQRIVLGYHYFMIEAVEVAVMEKLICKQRYCRF